MILLIKVPKGRVGECPCNVEPIKMAISKAYAEYILTGTLNKGQSTRKKARENRRAKVSLEVSSSLQIRSDDYV